MMKSLRTSTDVLSCEGIRHIEVTEVLDVAVTYEDNRTFTLKPRNRYTDYPDYKSEYARPKLLTRIIDFLHNEEHTADRCAVPSSYSFMVEEAIHEIMSQLYGNNKV